MKITFILGCGRSGTGILTRILAENGWSVPVEFVTSNYEDRLISGLNENILNYYDFNYFNIDGEIHPTKLPEIFSDQIEALIDYYKRLKNPLIKDPRMLFLSNCWIKHIDYEFIGIFRDPLEVAESHLKLYPNRSRDEYLKLWLNYNEQLLRLHKYSSFPILDFNSDTFINDIAGKLQVEISSSKYNPKKITKSEFIPINKSIHEVYYQLKEASK